MLYNLTIELHPNFANTYDRRGTLKFAEFNDIEGALADYNLVLQIDPQFIYAYGSRGLLKYNQLADRSGGIADIQSAAKLSQQQKNPRLYQTALDILAGWGVIQPN